MSVISLKYKLYHNTKLLRRLDKHRAVASQVYNHCIALHKRFYRLFKKYAHVNNIKNHLTKIKKLPKYAHWRILGSQAIQDIAERIDKAYKLYFQEHKTNKSIQPPTFKSRRHYKSFTLKQHGAGYQFLQDNLVRIGKKTYKYVKHREIEGDIKTLTIKKDSLGGWWLIIACDVKKPNPIKTCPGKTEGFDFGFKTFLTAASGNEYQAPLFFKQNIKQIRKLNRTLSRKSKCSKSRARAKQELALAHRKIGNKRLNFHFKLARELCNEFDVLCFETLDIESMKQRYGRKVSDLGFANFVNIQKHMANKYGKKCVFIDRWEPTTKTCSSCLYVLEELDLDKRVWVCPSCGVEHQRDVNAAKNILRIGASMLNSRIGRSVTCKRRLAAPAN